MSPGKEAEVYSLFCLGCVLMKPMELGSEFWSSLSHVRFPHLLTALGAGPPHYKLIISRWHKLTGRGGKISTLEEGSGSSHPAGALQGACEPPGLPPAQSVLRIQRFPVGHLCLFMCVEELDPTWRPNNSANKAQLLSPV